MPYDGLPSGSRNIHDCTHFPDGLSNAYKNRSADDRVADIELLDLGNGSHWADIASRQAVTGVDRQTNLMANPGSYFECAQGAGIVGVVCVPARVKLDRNGSQISRAAYGVFVRVNEETRADADSGKLINP